MNETLCLEAYDELYMIDLKQLLYFQADDHYSKVYYANGTHFNVPFGLSKVQDFIDRKPDISIFFIRLGRKYIVNVRRIFRISTTKDLLYLSDDHGNNIPLHISKPVLRALIDDYHNRLLTDEQ